jgi:hypothetical protein
MTQQFIRTFDALPPDPTKPIKVVPIDWNMSAKFEYLTALMVPKSRDYNHFATTRYSDLDSSKSTDSNTALRRKGESIQDRFKSVEGIHNDIHGLVGHNRDGFKASKNPVREGTMANVKGSSFDPIFWLHHW